MFVYLARTMIRCANIVALVVMFGCINTCSADTVVVCFQTIDGEGQLALITNGVAKILLRYDGLCYYGSTKDYIAVLAESKPLPANRRSTGPSIHVYEKTSGKLRHQCQIAEPFRVSSLGYGAHNFDTLALNRSGESAYLMGGTKQDYAQANTSFGHLYKVDLTDCSLSLEKRGNLLLLDNVNFNKCILMPQTIGIFDARGFFTILPLTNQSCIRTLRVWFDSNLPDLPVKTQLTAPHRFIFVDGLGLFCWDPSGWFQRLTEADVSAVRFEAAVKTKSPISGLWEVSTQGRQLIQYACGDTNGINSIYIYDGASRRVTFERQLSAYVSDARISANVSLLYLLDAVKGELRSAKLDDLTPVYQCRLPTKRSRPGQTAILSVSP